MAWKYLTYFVLDIIEIQFNVKVLCVPIKVQKNILPGKRL